MVLEININLSSSKNSRNHWLSWKYYFWTYANWTYFCLKILMYCNITFTSKLWVKRLSSCVRSSWDIQSNFWTSRHDIWLISQRWGQILSCHNRGITFRLQTNHYQCYLIIWLISTLYKVGNYIYLVYKRQATNTVDPFKIKNIL